MNNRIFGAVLAGGRSRRMGCDKAAILYEGTTLLERVVAAGLHAGLPMLVVGRERPQGFPHSSVRFVTDQYPDSGPLGGLLTAFAHLEGDCLALACDLPRLDSATLAWLLTTAASFDPAQDVVASVDGQCQPLFTLWRRSSTERLARAFAAGERSLIRCLVASGCAVIPLPEQFTQAVVDCDTPEDLARLRPTDQRDP